MLCQKEVRGKVGRRAPRQWCRTKPSPTWDYLRFIQRQKKTATCFLSNAHKCPLFFFLLLTHEQTFTHSRISVDIPASTCIPMCIPRFKLACTCIKSKYGIRKCPTFKIFCADVAVDAGADYPCANVLVHPQKWTCFDYRILSSALYCTRMLWDEEHF